jgi:hypothetical protein
LAEVNGTVKGRYLSKRELSGWNQPRKNILNLPSPFQLNDQRKYPLIDKTKTDIIIVEKCVRLFYQKAWLIFQARFCLGRPKGAQRLIHSGGVING